MFEIVRHVPARNDSQKEKVFCDPSIRNLIRAAREATENENLSGFEFSIPGNIEEAAKFGTLSGEAAPCIWTFSSANVRNSDGQVEGEALIAATPLVG
jgi:hypothetical protein